MPDSDANPVSGDDILLKTRMEGARDAQTRSRTAFFVATVICLAILIAAFNSYFGWDQRFSVAELSSKPQTKKTQEEQISEWVSSQTIAISLLGIRVSVSDAAPVGSVALFIISIWFFYCLRRENHAIGELLLDTLAANPKTRHSVYHGISGYLVFTSVIRNDDPIDDLDRPLSQTRPLFFIRLAVKALFFLPGITTFVVLGCDIYSLFTAATFRDPDQGLLALLKPHEWAHVALADALALTFGILTLMICIKCLKFEMATARVLKQYYERLSTVPPSATTTP